MSEEDIKKAKEEFEAREKEYQLKIAELEQDKQNTVEELIKKREAARLAEEELAKAKGNTGTDKGSDPEEIVKKVLQEKEAEASRNALEEAKADLKKLYNEFNPETDKAGIVFSKFEAELNKFNLSGLKTKEDYLNRFKEVYEFMNRRAGSPDKPNFYGGTRQSGSDAPTNDGVALSDSESKLIRDMGWDRERYLKIKEKRPAYVASLLKYRG